MRLPNLQEMLAARAEIARSSDYGPVGTKRLGTPGAPLVILNGLTYGDEYNALAAMWFFLTNPTLLQNCELALVLARHEETQPTANLNRLPIGPRDLAVAEYARVAELRAAFAGTEPVAVIDLQENSHPSTPEGWTLDVSEDGTDFDHIAGFVPTPIRLVGVTFVQRMFTNTAPLGSIYPGPVVEVLTWPQNRNGGIEAAVGTMTSVLSGLGMLNAEVHSEEREQHVYRAVDGLMPRQGIEYMIDPHLLSPFVKVIAGQVIATPKDGGAPLTSPGSCFLCLGPSKSEVVGGSDPLFYLCFYQHYITRKVATLRF